MGRRRDRRWVEEGVDDRRIQNGPYMHDPCYVLLRGAFGESTFNHLYTTRART